MTHSHVRVYLSIGSLIIAAGMIVGFYFVEIPKENVRFLDTALGFAAGFVTTTFGYYFGASSQSKTPLGENQNGTTNESGPSLDEGSQELHRSQGDSRSKTQSDYP